MAFNAKLLLTTCAVLAVAACATTGDNEARNEARIAQEVAQRQQLAEEYAALAEGQAGERANDGRICRITPMTGTRVRSTRTCLTGDEWRALATRQHQEAEELLRPRGWHTEQDF